MEEIKKKDLAELIDIFVSDCMMPSTEKDLYISDIYAVFSQFCLQLGIGTPCSVIGFGRSLKRRFQKRLINGKTKYFCEFKPGLIEEE